MWPLAIKEACAVAEVGPCDTALLLIREERPNLNPRDGLRRRKGSRTPPWPFLRRFLGSFPSASRRRSVSHPCSRTAAPISRSDPACPPARIPWLVGRFHGTGPAAAQPKAPGSSSRIRGPLGGYLPHVIRAALGAAQSGKPIRPVGLVPLPSRVARARAA